MRARKGNTYFTELAESVEYGKRVPCSPVVRRERAPFRHSASGRAHTTNSSCTHRHSVRTIAPPDPEGGPGDRYLAIRRREFLDFSAQFLRGSVVSTNQISAILRRRLWVISPWKTTVSAAKPPQKQRGGRQNSRLAKVPRPRGIGARRPVNIYIYIYIYTYAYIYIYICIYYQS